MRWGLVILLVVAVALTITGSSNETSSAENFPRGVLRLHILPNSDSKEDQELKLAVRDALLAALGPELRTATTAAEVYRWLGGRLEQVAEVAREELARQGRDDPVRVTLGRTYFPARQYGNLTLPAGEYQALQVLIGEGLGSNWWCVLFPPLCLVDVTTARAAEDREEEEAQGVQVRFKILEVMGVGH